MEKTRDYEKFKLLELNRNLNRGHINKLKASISKNGYLDGRPIMVNDDMEILDGQHRFIALKEMGLEVPYQIVDTGYDSIVDLNTTQLKWKINDYINFYCEKEHNPHYQRLKRMCKELNTTPTNILTISNSQRPDGTLFSKIKRGGLEFRIDDELRVNRIFEHFLAVAKTLRLNITSKLCGALITLSTKSRFSWDTMMQKAIKYPTLAYNCRTEMEFFQMLRNLYNYNTRKEEQKI